jgi:NADPH:quinone reductase-like Zn-dependent oxidoreductase
MATVEVATALGAGTVISTARNGDRARQAREVGLGEILDLSTESLRDGVARITSGEGVDVVVDGIGGPLTGELVAGLASRGVLVAVGYSAGTTARFDLTDLIWRTAKIKRFMFTLFPSERIHAANETLLGLVAGTELPPRVARVLPLDEAAEAQRHLVEDQPDGRVLLAPDPSRVSR